MLRRALAGADIVVLPSLYEPGTAAALRALRYGAIVVARRTGGLADALRECDSASFFDEFTVGAFDTALRDALATDRKGAPTRVRAALAVDTSWSHAVAAYDAAYQRALDSRSLA